MDAVGLVPTFLFMSRGQRTDGEMLELLEPIVNSLGYELVDLQCRASARDGLLRVFIDCEQGVTLADCEHVSRQLSAYLDVEDPMPGQYRLEVSSPGLDRALRTEAHFLRFIGAQVMVDLKQPLEGRRRFKGELAALQDEMVVVQADGQQFRLPLAMIDKARLVPVLN